MKHAWTREEVKEFRELVPEFMEVAGITIGSVLQFQARPMGVTLVLNIWPGGSKAVFAVWDRAWSRRIHFEDVTDKLKKQRSRQSGEK